MSNLATLAVGQPGATYIINELFDAISPAAFGGRIGAACAGSRFPVFGGAGLGSGHPFTDSAGEARPLAALDVKPTAYPYYVRAKAVGGLAAGAAEVLGEMTLYALTAAGAWQDLRGNPNLFSGRRVLAMPDATAALTADQLRCRQLRITGAHTASRRLNLAGPGVWLIENQTGQALSVDGSTTIPAGRTVCVARGFSGGVYWSQSVCAAPSVATAFVELDAAPALVAGRVLRVGPAALQTTPGEAWRVATASGALTLSAASAGTLYSASALNVTCPDDVTIPAGSRWRFSGAATVAAGSGATVRVPAGKGPAPGGVFELIKLAAAEYALWGELAATGGGGPLSVFMAIKASAIQALAFYRAGSGTAVPPAGYGPAGIGSNPTAYPYAWIFYGTNLQLSDMTADAGAAFNNEIQGTTAVGGYVGPTLGGLPYAAFAPAVGYAALFTHAWLDANP